MATHKLQLEEIGHIGIIVKDVDKVVESWERMFGIGPWVVRDLGGPVEGETIRVKMAWANLGPVQIELTQPVEGRTIHADFLDTHGEGLHHLGFPADDVDGEAANLVAQGAKIIMQQPGGYAFLEGGWPGGFILELVRKR